MFPHNYFPPAMWLQNGAPATASELFVANIALQKLGAGAISSMSEDKREAVLVNSCYALMRDLELRAHLWHFSKTRQVLAPSATVPAFGNQKAFQLPTGCLRILPPSRDVDWEIELIDNVPHILSSEGDTLLLRYIKRVTDATVFDPLFVDMLACRIAWHLCEAVTQSNTKKDSIKDDYKLARNMAKKINAFEAPSPQEPEDDWIISRSYGERNWLRWGEV